MRLVIRKPLYRAFPELDGYSDERCRRFVAAANRSWAGWWMARFKQLLAAAFALFVELLIFGVLVEVLPANVITSDLSEDGIFLLVMLAGLIPPPVVAMVVGDLHLRDRLREVLQVSAMCHGCGYSLIGVPVGQDGDVVCPECGFSSAADPALGELTRDESGRRVYQPPGS